MTIYTRNTRYQIRDLGDGAFLIQGNETYCPRPLRVMIPFQPEVGKFFVFIPQEGEREGHRIVTTTVQQVLD